VSADVAGNITQVVDGVTTAALTIPAEVVPPGISLEVTIIASNGYTSSNATILLQKSALEIPIVTSDSGSVVRATENGGTRIRGRVVLGPCLQAGTAISIVWLGTSGSFPSARLYSTAGLPIAPVWNPDNLTAVLPLTNSKRGFVVDGIPAGTYGLSLCAIACPNGADCTSSCTDIDLIVGRPPLSVTVNGLAAYVTIPLSLAALSLSAVVADSSIVPAPVGNVTESWSCSGSCVLTSTGLGTATVSGVSAGNTYSFMYTWTNSEDSRVASFSGSFSVVQGPSVALVTEEGTTLYDPSDAATIVADISGVVTSTAWSCLVCDTVFQVALLTGDPSVFPVLTATEIRIAGGVANPGSSQQFSLAVSGPAGTSYASITINYKPAPTCLFGTNGEAPWTFFAYACQGAVAFQFGMVAQGEPLSSGVWFGVASSNPVFTFASIQPGNQTVFCVVSGDGATAVVSLDVTIPTPLSPNVSATADAFGNSLTEGDPSGAQQGFLVWSSYAALSSSSRRLAAAATRAVEDRTAIIEQLPSLGALLDNSAAATSSRLGYILAAIQFPGTVAVGAAQSAANYTEQVLSGAMSRGETLLSTSQTAAVSIVSWLEDCVLAAPDGGVSEYEAFTAGYSNPILRLLSVFVAQGLIVGQAVTVTASTYVSLGVAVVSTSGTASEYDATGIAIPTSLQTTTLAASVALDLNAGFGAAFENATGSSAPNLTVTAAVYSVLPYVSSVVGNVTVTTPSVRVEAVSPSGLALSGSGLSRPYALILPLLSSASTSPAAADI